MSMRPADGPAVKTGRCSHLDPNRRRVWWSHLQGEFRRQADGPGASRSSSARPGSSSPGSVFAAWRACKHEHHDRQRLQAEIAPIKTELNTLLKEASPKNRRNRWHRQFANNLLNTWPALWTFTTVDRLGLGLADINPEHLPDTGLMDGVGDHQRLLSAPRRAL